MRKPKIPSGIEASASDLDQVMSKAMALSGFPPTTREQRITFLFCLRAAYPNIMEELLENKEKLFQSAAV